MHYALALASTKTTATSLPPPIHDAGQERELGDRWTNTTTGHQAQPADPAQPFPQGLAAPRARALRPGNSPLFMRVQAPVVSDMFLTRSILGRQEEGSPQRPRR